MTENVHLGKLGVNEFITTTGVVGEYSLDNNDFARFTVEGANPSNAIELRVKVDGQSTWKLQKTLTGADSIRIETNSYDQLQIACTTLDGTNVKILGSGFKLG